jgi:hypothetical protein
LSKHALPRGRDFVRLASLATGVSPRRRRDCCLGGLPLPIASVSSRLVVLLCFLFSWLAILGVSLAPLASITQLATASCPSHFPHESGLVFPNQSRRQDPFLRISMDAGPRRSRSAALCCPLPTAHPPIPSMPSKRRVNAVGAPAACSPLPPPSPFFLLATKQTNPHVEKKKV